MSKILWKSLLASPVLLGAALAVAPDVNALEATENFEVLNTDASIAEVNELLAQSTIPQEIAQATTETTIAQNDDLLLDQIEQYSAEGSLNSQDQVTSVNELRDVTPDAWAYEALRSLVERYGCIVGYPDRTFRGNKALSRWEFAAGLNACMNVMERLIQENVAVLREDIEKLKRLMEEFQAELAALGARVDNLESRVAFLEDHQFSTTTKLTGEVIFAVSGLASGNEVGNQTVFQDRVRLVLNTSFSGEDRLVTRLSAGNSSLFQLRNTQDFASVGVFDSDRVSDLRDLGFDIPDGVDSFDVGIFGTARLDRENPLTSQTWQNTQTGNDVNIDWLAYYVPVKFSEDFVMNGFIAGFGGLWYDFVPTLNPYFEDYDGGNGSLTIFAQRNPIYNIGGGAGAGASLQVGFLEGILGPTSLSFGYLSGTADNPNEGFGLFNGNYTALGQLNFNIGDAVNFGITYSHGYFRPESPIFGFGALEGAGLTGTSLANLSSTNLNSEAADTQVALSGRVQTFDDEGDLTFQDTQSGVFSGADLPGGSSIFDISSKATNSYGLEMAWNIADWITASAFGSYTNVTLIGVDTGDIWTYGGGLAFPDAFKEGNVLGIFAGVQPYLTGLTIPTINPISGFREVAQFSTQNPITVELFYKYQVNDNISLTPGVIWISNPDQIGDTDDAVIGTLRGTFTF